MKILFTLLLTTLTLFLYGQGCSITTSNLIELSGDDGSGNCTYSIDILFTEGSGPDNGTLTFSSPSATILTGAGPHSCACSGTTYTLTFEAVCGSTVSFTAFHDNSGNGNDCSVSIVNIVLAVQWLNFDVKKENNHITSLNWSTSSEVNNERFEIEFSKDGNTYDLLGSVPGSGTTYQSTNYEYRHFHYETGIIYYRIKQIDYDGHYSYSEIRHLSLSDVNSTVFPNPTKGLLFVTVENKDALIHVFDSSGRKLMSTSNDQIDLTPFRNGLYTIQVLHGNKVEKHLVFLSR